MARGRRLFGPPGAYVGDSPQGCKEAYKGLLWWVAVLACKLTFSYFFQIQPLVEPSVQLWREPDSTIPLFQVPNHLNHLSPGSP